MISHGRHRKPSILPDFQSRRNDFVRFHEETGATISSIDFRDKGIVERDDNGH